MIGRIEQLLKITILMLNDRNFYSELTKKTVSSKVSDLNNCAMDIITN